MNRTRWPWGLVRTLVYIGGILCALILALFSLLLAGADELWGSLLSGAAWLGCLGLVAALVWPPSREAPGCTQAICALLLCGLTASLPLLIMLAQNPDTLRSAPSLSAAILAPAGVALHYLWRALRLFSAAQRLGLGLVLLLAGATLGLVYLLQPRPPLQVIHATAPTDAITLIIEEGTPGLTSSMGLSYASKLPYAAIHHRDRTYRPLPAQARTSIPWDGTGSRYVVKESLLANPHSERWPQRVVWTLHDRQTGQLMARRELWRRGISEWSRDTPSGWQGEHAADFIRQVLRPNAARRLSGGYPRAHVRVEEWRDRQPLSREAVERRVVGCAAGIGLIHDGPRTYLQSSTPNWRFENLYPMGQVFCLGTDIYVISQLLAQELYIDRLDVTGRLLGQWHASASRALDREHLPVLHIASLGVEGHVMRLRLAWLEELPETGSLRLPDKSALLRLDMAPRHASD